MLKRSVQILLGFVMLVFSVVMLYAAIQDGLVTLNGISNLICSGFSIAVASDFLRGSTSSEMPS